MESVEANTSLINLMIINMKSRNTSQTQILIADHSPSNFHFTTKEQARYIFGETLALTCSGAIVVFSSKTAEGNTE